MFTITYEYHWRDSALRSHRGRASG